VARSTQERIKAQAASSLTVFAAALSAQKPNFKFRAQETG